MSLQRDTTPSPITVVSAADSPDSCISSEAMISPPPPLVSLPVVTCVFHWLVNLKGFWRGNFK